MHLKRLNDIETFTFGTENNAEFAAATCNGAAPKFLKIGSNSEIDRVRAVANHVIEKLGEIENPVMMMDLEKVAIQYRRWIECFPTIEPYYAVKCNPDLVLVRYLQSLGVQFDCATSAEMDLIVNQLGHPADKVVYSNPCKLPSHIRFAADCGVRLTIVDNKDEIWKIKRNHPHAQVLLRLSCLDTSSLCPMSCKFGASDDNVRPLLEYAVEVGLEVVGVHFHVGSGCSDPQTYQRALLDARRAFDIGIELGHDMHVLDLGGGWPGLNPNDNTCKTSSGIDFEQIALGINSLIDELFPNDPSSPQYRIMAEPGRFFTAGSTALLSYIHSKSVLMNEYGQKNIRYYLNDGLYGVFNSVIFDHQHPTPETLDHFSEDEVTSRGMPASAAIFGPTCDGFDKVTGNADNLPEMELGERLVWLSMGAYTNAASTTFNGFPQAQFFYYKAVQSIMI
jgi:ornithine decarboxylase